MPGCLTLDLLGQGCMPLDAEQHPWGLPPDASSNLQAADNHSYLEVLPSVPWGRLQLRTARFAIGYSEWCPPPCQTQRLYHIATGGDSPWSSVGAMGGGEPQTWANLAGLSLAHLRRSPSSLEGIALPFSLVTLPEATKTS